MDPNPVTTTVIIVTHQSAEFVGEVLDALEDPDRRPDEIVVVDNASTDGTRSILDRYDVVRVDLDDNRGFTGGCHAGVGAATGSILVFLGHDSIPEPGWLDPLVRTVADDRIGAAMATLVDADDPTRFNTSGGHLSYIGLAWVSGLGDPVPTDEPELLDVAFPSGAAMAIRREVWDRFDGFRPDLFMYLEDADLGWRMRLAGLGIVRCSRSRVRHRYEFGRSPGKLYWLERNRWLILASNYRLGTLVTIAPALAVAEIGVAIVAARDGWFPTKVRAARDAFGARSDVASARRRVERLRTRGDASMIGSMDATVTTVRQVAAPVGSGLADAFLRTWRAIALPLLRLLDRR